MSVPHVAPPEFHASSGAWVQVAQVRMLADGFDATLAALAPSQRQRWERLHRAQDRDDFLAARMLAAALVECVLGSVGTVAFVQVCETCGGSHGRPQAVDEAGSPLPVEVSWAHSDGVVAAAVLAGHVSQVGVDVEHLDPLATVPGLTCSGRSFVRGEAAVKAGALTLDAAVAGEFDWPLGDSGEVGSARAWDIPTQRDDVAAALAVRRITYRT